MPSHPPPCPPLLPLILLLLLLLFHQVVLKFSPRLGQEVGRSTNTIYTHKYMDKWHLHVRPGQTLWFIYAQNVCVKLSAGVHKKQQQQNKHTAKENSVSKKKMEPVPQDRTHPSNHPYWSLQQQTKLIYTFRFQADWLNNDRKQKLNKSRASQNRRKAQQIFVCILT